MSLLFVWAAVASLVCTTQGLEARYFYSPVLDHCQQNGQFVESNELTAHGGVCAYVPGTDRLYSCPAPDPTCWSFSQTCGKGSQASSSQILCENQGSTWCCTADETCTTSPGQINVCISNFASPDSGLSLPAAVSQLDAALGVSTVTKTASQAADPTFFSTSTFLAASSSSASTASKISSSSATSKTAGQSSPTSIVTSTSTSATTSPSSASSNSNSNNGHYSSHSSLSGGALAGIIIGALIGIAIIAAAIFFGLRKRGQNRNETEFTEEQRGPMIQPELPSHTVEYYGNDIQKKNPSQKGYRYAELSTPPESQHPFLQEMGGGNHSTNFGRHELTGSTGPRAELPS